MSGKKEEKKGRRGKKEREHGTHQDYRIYGRDTSGKSEGKKGRKRQEGLRL
jgi:hypothetical protein